MAKEKEVPVPVAEQSRDRTALMAILAALGVGRWVVVKAGHMEAAAQGRLRLTVEHDSFTSATNFQVNHNE